LYDDEPGQSLKETLVEAVKRNTHTGTSTAVLAKLESGDKVGKLTTTNLGDSGYLIFRQDSRGILKTIF